MTFHAHFAVAVLLGVGAASAQPVAGGQVEPAAEGRTTVGVELTGGEAHNTWDPKRFNPIAYKDTVGVNDRQVITAVHATHETTGGFRFGIRLGHVAGEGPSLEERRRIGTPESRDVVLDEQLAYTLFAVGALAGYRGENAGVDVGFGVVFGTEGKPAVRPGVRGMWGDLSLADGDSQLWFEASLGTVDSLPEISQIAVGGGVGTRHLTLRLGFEGSNLPSYDPQYCDGCVLTAADGGGPYVDATVHVGPVDVRLRGVLRDEPRGLVGMGFVF